MDPHNNAIFLDRDGTIIRDKGYVHKKEDLEFIIGAASAIKKLSQQNYSIIVVTQQSGIGQGYFTEEQYHEFNEHFLNKLTEQNAKVDAVYFCAHHPTKGIGQYLKNCECRKPKTGMIMRAQAEHNIDLSKSWVIGDKTSDVKMGENAGCRAILVQTGKAGQDGEFKISPTYQAKDLLDAARFILINDNTN